MSLVVEKKYTRDGVAGAMRGMVWPILIGLVSIGVTGIESYLAPDAGNRTLAVVFVAAFMWMVFNIALLSLGNRMSEIALRLEAMQAFAGEMQAGDDLFARFRPTQEAVDHRLTLLAINLDEKCQDKALFYSKFRTILADRPLPLVIVNDPPLQRQANDEAKLQGAITEARDQFESLYRRVKSRKFAVRDRWSDYLPEERRESEPSGQ